jgi:hypothetical protein
MREPVKRLHFTLTLALFHYLDLDLPPGASDDRALRLEWETVEITDSPVVATYLSEAPDRHQISTPTLQTELNDTAITQLSNGSSPFGPADFAGASQWNLVLPPQGSVEVKVLFAVNYPYRWCFSIVGVFCDGFESHDPSFWSLSVP